MFDTLIAWLDRMTRVSRSRRALSRLNDDQLRDIGVSRSEAHHEVQRAPWNFNNHDAVRGSSRETLRGVTRPLRFRHR